MVASLLIKNFDFETGTRGNTVVIAETLRLLFYRPGGTTPGSFCTRLRNTVPRASKLWN
jgi:hypothetical protein